MTGRKARDRRIQYMEQRSESTQNSTRERTEATIRNMWRNFMEVDLACPSVQPASIVLVPVRLSPLHDGNDLITRRRQ